MDSAFREPTPEEAKLLALQFMGQNMGEIKELDRNIISRTNSLQGNILNVNNVLNSIPTAAQPQLQQQLQQQQIVQQPQRHLNAAPVALQSSTPQIHTDTTSIVDVLNKINSNLESLIKVLDK